MIYCKNDFYFFFDINASVFEKTPDKDSIHVFFKQTSNSFIEALNKDITSYHLAEYPEEKMKKPLAFLALGILKLDCLNHEAQENLTIHFYNSKDSLKKIRTFIFELQVFCFKHNLTLALKKLQEFKCPPLVTPALKTNKTSSIYIEPKKFSGIKEGEFICGPDYVHINGDSISGRMKFNQQLSEVKKLDNKEF